MKVGDKVTIITRQWGEKFKRVSTIQKETVNYWVVDGVHYRKSNLMVRSNLANSWLEEITDDL